MTACAVYGCANSIATNPDALIQYYYFPKHPVVAQQWVAACWRADPIDLDNAQICSMHFDNNSYTTEYKEVDCHYARMLKYDAIPTLYLPPQHIVLKGELNHPVALNITNANTQNDIKNLVIYDVQDVTFDANLIQQPTLLPINSELKFLNIVPAMHNENFNKHLETIKDENEALKQNIASVEDTIKNLENELSEKTRVFNAKENQISVLMRKYDMLRRSRMTTVEQKAVLSKVFSETQLKILAGKKKIYWTNDDLAIGYTIWSLSNKRCYKYLTKNLNIPLPAPSSIGRWAKLKNNKQLKEEIEFEDGNIC